MRRGDAFHAGFLLAMCAFLISQPFIRDWHGFIFLAFVAVAFAYALTSSRPVIIPPLLGFSLVGAAYVALSYLDVFPDAWTTVYEPSLIPRQAFYVVLFYPLVLSATALWSWAIHSNHVTTTFLVILGSVAVVEPLVGIVVGTPDSAVTAFSNVTTGGLGNARLLMYMALTYFVFVRYRKGGLGLVAVLSLTVGLGLLFAYVVDDAKAQNIVGLAAILLVAFIRPTRRTVVALTLIGIAMYAALLPFADRIYEIDPNAGYRLALTRDALRGGVESYGLGVGFGKEVLTGQYSQYGMRERPEISGATTLAVQGVHNSFAQEFMRLGVVGVAYLVWLFLGACVPPTGGPVGIRRHLAVVYLLVLLALMVNVGLESPTYIVGIAFAVGYVLVAKDAIVGSSHSSSMPHGSGWELDEALRTVGPRSP